MVDPSDSGKVRIFVLWNDSFLLTKVQNSGKQISFLGCSVEKLILLQQNSIARML